MNRTVEVALTSSVVFALFAVWLYIILDVANSLFEHPHVMSTFIFFIASVVGTWAISLACAQAWDQTFPRENDDITGEEL